MSRKIDTTDPSQLTVEDWGYLRDRNLITEELQEFLDDNEGADEATGSDALRNHLNSKTKAQLLALCSEKGIDTDATKKADIIDEMIEWAAENSDDDDGTDGDGSD